MYTQCTYIQHSKRLLLCWFVLGKVWRRSFILYLLIVFRLLDVSAHTIHAYIDTHTRRKERGWAKCPLCTMYILPYWSSASCVFLSITATRVLFTQFLYLTFSNLFFSLLPFCVRSFLTPFLTFLHSKLKPYLFYIFACIEMCICNMFTVFLTSLHDF